MFKLYYCTGNNKQRCVSFYPRFCPGEKYICLFVYADHLMMLTLRKCFAFVVFCKSSAAIIHQTMQTKGWIDLFGPYKTLEYRQGTTTEAVADKGLRLQITIEIINLFSPLILIVCTNHGCFVLTRKKMCPCLSPHWMLKVTADRCSLPPISLQLWNRGRSHTLYSLCALCFLRHTSSGGTCLLSDILSNAHLEWWMMFSWAVCHVGALLQII